MGSYAAHECVAFLSHIIRVSMLVHLSSWPTLCEGQLAVCANVMSIKWQQLVLDQVMSSCNFMIQCIRPKGRHMNDGFFPGKLEHVMPFFVCRTMFGCNTDLPAPGSGCTCPRSWRSMSFPFHALGHFCQSAEFSVGARCHTHLTNPRSWIAYSPGSSRCLHLCCPFIS